MFTPHQIHSPLTSPRKREREGYPGSKRAWARLALICLSSIACPAPGQLAITEVMSYAAVAEESPPWRRPDYWELTNFGRDTIDLSPYRFTDDTGPEAGDAALMRGKSIGPGESILFVRTAAGRLENGAGFRQWWGSAQLPSPLQIYFYNVPGFDNVRDAVRLWKWEDDRPVLMQTVSLGEATEGFSFTYDLESGTVDQLSVPDEPGSIRSATGSDVGSPGTTRGPVKLKILSQPRSISSCIGREISLRVEARGLPAPRYQWLKDGQVLAGRTESELKIPFLSSSDRGRYLVRLDNGLEQLNSETVRVEVEDQLKAPEIETSPSDVELTMAQTAVLSVRVCANPPPTYQWFHDERPLPAETGPDLRIKAVDSFSPGLYRVEISNALGTISTEARISLVEKPQLLITEILAEPSTKGGALGHQDWWELTSVHPEPVRLGGYQWDDSPGLVRNATRLPTNLVIQPGESIIFVEGMSREEFVRWWGPHNLPANLQVISYHANGFQQEEDSVTLFGPHATENPDHVCSVGFADAPLGISLWFDPVLAPFGAPSVEGERGAFRSVESNDLGSPGWVEEHEVPLHLRMSYEDREIRLQWATQPGRVYQLLSADSLDATTWEVIYQRQADGQALSMVDLRQSPPGHRRFYKLLAQVP
ncbi:MAG: immunoglobulin domain-containing protein [Verrucomicrobiales bacterium]|nr:immunoglobulin domain-containing protein [Verrucomicrobiales bacterium]